MKRIPITTEMRDAAAAVFVATRAYEAGASYSGVELAKVALADATTAAIAAQRLARLPARAGVPANCQRLKRRRTA